MFFQEFKKFAVRGNVIDLAVGVIVGAAFTGIVNSLVKDIINPLLGLATGGTDLSDHFLVLKNGAAAPPPGGYLTLANATKAGAVTLNYGLFVNAVFSFLVVAFVLFLIVRQINKLKTPPPPASPAAPPPSEEVLLLREIRDSLKDRP